MSRRLAILVSLLMALVFCGSAYALDIAPSVVGNDQIIKARLGFGDPVQGLVGPVVGWNDQDPQHLWAAGVFGQYDVSPQVQTFLTDVFQVPQSWWDILTKIGARAYVGDEVMAAGLGQAAQASNLVYFGAGLGPIVLEGGYALFEGGKLRTPDGVIAESGLTWFAGLQWTFRF